MRMLHGPGLSLLLFCLAVNAPARSEELTNSASGAVVGMPASVQEQSWNWHVQNTIIGQGYPGFYAKYAGPNSLPIGGVIPEAILPDLFAGAVNGISRLHPRYLSAVSFEYLAECLPVIFTHIYIK